MSGAAVAVALAAFVPATAFASPQPRVDNTTPGAPVGGIRLAPGLKLKGSGPVRTSAQVAYLRSTAAGRAELAPDEVAGPNGSTCLNDENIISYANQEYVTTEIGDGGTENGILRARATEVGPWELYTECWFTDTSGRSVHEFESQANGLWVSTEYGYTGDLYEVLRARASTPGEWEHFYVGIPQDWQCDFQSVHIGRYVSAELGYSGIIANVLRARATTLGPWEIFGTA